MNRRKAVSGKQGVFTPWGVGRIDRKQQIMPPPPKHSPRSTAVFIDSAFDVQ